MVLKKVLGFLKNALFGEEQPEYRIVEQKNVNGDVRYVPQRYVFSWLWHNQKNVWHWENIEHDEVKSGLHVTVCSRQTRDEALHDVETDKSKRAAREAEKFEDSNVEYA